MLYYSLVDNAQKLTFKLTSIISQVRITTKSDGKISEKEYLKIVGIEEQIKKLKLFIGDGPFLNFNEFRVQTIKNIKENNVELIIIDDIEYFYPKGTSTGRDRNLFKSEIVHGLEQLALELNVCIIFSCHLNAAVERNGGEKIPDLMNINDSGTTYQIADKVIFLHRPEYYRVLEDENGESNINLLRVKIALNRNGQIGNLALFADMENGWVAEKSDVLQQLLDSKGNQTIINGFDRLKSRLTDESPF